MQDTLDGYADFGIFIGIEVKLHSCVRLFEYSLEGASVCDFADEVFQPGKRLGVIESKLFYAFACVCVSRNKIVSLKLGDVFRRFNALIDKKKKRYSVALERFLGKDGICGEPDAVCGLDSDHVQRVTGEADNFKAIG